ncbi:hypothetical protein BDA99DRAFT_564428 [Phascolomyces articulosus]|uniref:Uncharacterized protein n=1 Tax=Phascolomyces articulosus TaxID=60185 RepID=A0AAD5P9I2_9FUNG|nr:hypothetical protein BDA99DRAFT_564428 [Phascolomyces articulosus]
MATLRVKGDPEYTSLARSGKNPQDRRYPMRRIWASGNELCCPCLVVMRLLPWKQCKKYSTPSTAT